MKNQEINFMVRLSIIGGLLLVLYIFITINFINNYLIKFLITFS